MNQRHLLRFQRQKTSGGLTLGLACVLCMMLFQSANAVVLPYATTFSDVSEWTASAYSGPASWSAVPGGYQAVTAQPNGGYNYTLNDSAVSVTGLGPASSANSFVVTSHFTITAASNEQFFVGFGALGTSASFLGTGSGTYYQTRVSDTGRLQILAFSPSGVSELGNADFTDLALNTSYELQLQGNYDLSGNLSLNFTIIDTTNPLSTASAIATIANASVATGNHFGLTSEIVNGSGDPGASFTTVFSDYSVALVPEPATYALILSGLGAWFLMGRRSRANFC